MSMTPDMLRREASEHHDVLTRLIQQEDEFRAAIARVESQLAALRTGLEANQAQQLHEAQTVEALQAAAALLAERLPMQEISWQPLQLLPGGVEPEPGPGLDDPELDEEEQRFSSHYTMTYAIQKAGELDLEEVRPFIWDRCEVIAQALRERGPMRQFEIARALVGVLDGSPGSVRNQVQQCIPVLFRVGRIKPVDQDRTRFVIWCVTPAELASAGLGTDVRNFEGRTTTWPEGGRAPGNVPVRIETQPFESKK